MWLKIMAFFMVSYIYGSNLASHPSLLPMKKLNINGVKNYCNRWSLQMLPSAKGASKDGLYVYSWLKSYKKIGEKIDVYNWGKLREFSSWDVSKFPVVMRFFWNMISFVKVLRSKKLSFNQKKKKGFN